MGQLTRYFAAQILSGIAYCHSKDIIHSDIKGSNVLIMPDTTIRLCDFGLSWDLKAKGDGQQDLERFAGQVWLFGVSPIPALPFLAEPVHRLAKCLTITLCRCPTCKD